MKIRKKDIPNYLFFITVILYIATSFFAVSTKMHALIGYGAFGIAFVTFCVRPIIRLEFTKLLGLCVTLYSILCLISCSLSDYGFSHETTKGRLISTLLLMNLFLFFSIFITKDTLNYKVWFFYALAIIGIAFAFKTYSLNELADGFAGIIRLGKELSGINSYGMYFSLLAVFSAFQSFNAKNNSTRIWNVILFVALFILAATSGSRKALLGIIIGVALLTLLLAQHNKLITIAKILLFIFVVYYLLRDFSFAQGIISRLSTIWDNSNQVVYQSDLQRDSMTEYALQGWLEHPLFGNGFNAFISKSPFNTYSHNNYAELLYNLGLIGVSLFYLPKIYIVYVLFKTMNNKDNRWHCLYFTFTILLLLFDFKCVSYYDTLLNYIWWFSALEIKGYNIKGLKNVNYS